ncbi:MAG: alpha-E domain-containing protein [Gemmatimonadota bacterium]|jgi:uncharacterized alpha-E superfamily protein
MISRVAESCYWLMRYIERCDTATQLLRVQAGMVLDTVLPDHRRWRPLLVVSGERANFEALYGEEAMADGERVQEYLTWSDLNPASIFSSVRAARENARTTRETISLEMWNSLNHFWIWLREDETREMYETDRLDFYERVGDYCSVFGGILYKTMLHEEPFDFMRLGLHLERAGQTARILDLHHHALRGRTDVPTETLAAAEWISILRTRYAYEPFFKKRKGSLTGPAVAKFLLQEPAFPSSVAYTLTRAQAALERIRPPGSPIGRGSAERLNKLRAGVVGLNVDRAVESDIHDVLTHIVDATAEVSQTIGEEYFYAVLPEPLESEVVEA